MPTPRRRLKAPKAEKTLRAIGPNEGIRLAYQRKLERLIDEMEASVLYWIRAAYRANPPALAQDDTAAQAMKRAMRQLIARWLDRFEEGAQKLAAYFSQSVSQRSDAVLKKILKDAGFSIDWRMTPAQREIIQATVEQNVALIKSIPQQCLGRVEVIVMQSVQNGRGLHEVVEELQKQFHVTKKRAKFIATDQNSKAMAALNRARYLELGLQEAVWMHSGGGKHPRPTHVKAGRDKVRFNIAEGWHDPDPKVDKKIQPGELINCRCQCRAIVPAFERRA